MKMSNEQLRFKEFIESKLPYLKHLFDFNTRDCLFDVIDNYLTVASRHEEIMARFVVTVWLRDNRYNFDLIDARRTLDTKELNIIYGWVNDPIWP